tara:strand:- start:2 stop:301 length:300 start_codon:yes stop_codon:yes gene_type:complete
MKNLKLNDKELILIINALTDQIRYKGVQKLLVNMQNQLQEQDELLYVEKEYLKVFETDKELIDWLRDRGVEGTDEYIINESIQIGEVEQIKRSELTDTE